YISPTHQVGGADDDAVINIRYAGYADCNGSQSTLRGRNFMLHFFHASRYQLDHRFGSLKANGGGRPSGENLSRHVCQHETQVSASEVNSRNVAGLYRCVRIL